MSNRANSTNSIGIGVTQTQAGNVATSQTWVTTFPRPAGGTILVTKAVQGASVNDNVERDSDGGFWDTTAGVPVAPENTNVGINDMESV
jgi:hypothetical protein